MYDLVVTNPFGNFTVGQRITDDAEVERLSGSPNVVRVAKDRPPIPESQPAVVSPSEPEPPVERAPEPKSRGSGSPLTLPDPVALTG